MITETMRLGCAVSASEKFIVQLSALVMCQALNISLCHEVGVLGRGWVTCGEISQGRGRRPVSTVGVRKLQWLPFRLHAVAR